MWQHLSLAAQNRRGKSFAADGTLAPPLSHGDLASLVQEWRNVAGAAAFPLWSQYGAVAYAWDPAQPSVFVTTPAQRDSLVDTETANDFWLATYRLALDLDDDPTKSPRLDIDAGAFDDPVWRAQVQADLMSDGARVAWKVPLAACKDKDGKARPARLGCPAGWDLVKDGGVWVCRKRDTGEKKPPGYVCEGEQITVDDPITTIKKRTFHGLLILGVLWWLATRDDKPARRNRRDR